MHSLLSNKKSDLTSGVPIIGLAHKAHVNSEEVLREERCVFLKIKFPVFEILKVFHLGSKYTPFRWRTLMLLNATSLESSFSLISIMPSTIGLRVFTIL